MAAVIAHLEQDVPDPRDLCSALSSEVAELVMRLMAKTPEDRPASAAEVAEAIDALVGEGSTARRPAADPLACADTLELLGASRFRHGAAVGRSGLTLLALVACLVVGGAALIAATRGPAEVASGHSLRPARGVEPRPPAALAPGARRAVVASTAEAAVRILVPEAVVAAKAQDVGIDVWDAHGQPTARKVKARLVDSAGTSVSLRVQATEMPGRYRVDHEFATSGSYLLVVEIGAETSLSVQVEVADASPRS